jgi:beta-glucanase (GH16 family)
MSKKSLNAETRSSQKKRPERFEDLEAGGSGSQCRLLADVDAEAGQGRKLGTSRRRGDSCDKRNIGILNGISKRWNEAYVVPILEELTMAMIRRSNSRFVFRSGSLLAILVVSLAGPGRANAQTWNLVPSQSDEFNGPANSPIDTTKWRFDYGNLHVNNELEWYCGPVGDPQNMPPCDSTKPNIFIDGSGHLVFQAYRINNTLVNGSWTSGRMQTNGTMTFQYGRLEASMSLPVGAGLWPAFWALGSNFATVSWPGCGEMDFMENVPASPGGLGPTKIRSTIHGPGYSGGNGLGQDFMFPNGSDVTGFHVYGAIWSPNMVQFYVDSPNNVFFIRTANDVPGGPSQWVFNHPFINITNLAVGGSFPGNPDSTTPSPATMLVDYIHYYQRPPVQTPTLGNPPAITIKAGATTGNGSTLMIGDSVGSGRVYLSCSTTAPKATCTIATGNTLNPSVIDFTSSATASVTVTVATVTNSMAPRFFFGPRAPSRPLIASAAFLLLLFLGFVLRAQRRAWRQVRGTAAVLILVGAAIAGCGGNSVTTTPSPGTNGTPPGSYTVTVFAFTESNNSDGTNANADAHIDIPLTVN